MGSCVLWLAVPLIILINVLKGLVGHTSYRNQVESFLTEKAKKIYSSLPEKVVLGLSQPIGDNAEIAWKYIVEQFDSEADQKWARRFITQAKDVLAVTTSLIIIFLGFSVSLAYKTTGVKELPASIAADVKKLEDAIEGLPEGGLKTTLKGIDFVMEPRVAVERYRRSERDREY